MNNTTIKKQNWRLVCGMIAGPFFIISFLIQGTIRPGYNPLRHPISTLALGNPGWVQTLSFLLAGLLMLIYALELRKRFLNSDQVTKLGVYLIILLALGQIAAGVFPTDPVNGYPVGSPLDAPATWHGILHNLAALTVFFGAPLICFLLASRFKKAKQLPLAIYTLLSGVLIIISVVLEYLGMKHVTGLVGLTGLFQRMALMTAFIWLAVLAYFVYTAKDRLVPTKKTLIKISN